MQKNTGFVPSLAPFGNNAKSAISKKPLTSNPTQMNLRGNQATSQTQMNAGRQKKRTRNKTSTQRGGNDIYVPLVISDSSISGEDFSQTVERTPFYDERKGDPVFFRADVEPVYFTQNYDKPKHGDDIINNRFSYNLATYHDKSALTTPQVIVDTPTVEHYETIFRQMGREVRSKVKSGSLYNKWTFGNWYKTIHATIYALEIFYTVDSILSYTGNAKERSKNDALLEYRKLVEESSDVLYLKDTLRRRLEGCWFPKPFAQLIQWTYQNYRIADLPQAEVIRFMPDDCFIKAVPADNLATRITQQLNYANGLLDDDTVTSIWSILSDVYPDGLIKGLAYSSNDSHYDARIVEVFCNQPTMYYNGTSNVVFPHAQRILATSGHFTYGSITDPTTDRTSGLPFVLQTVFEDENQTPFIHFFKAFHRSESQELYYNINKFSTIYIGGVLYSEARLRETSTRFNLIPDVHFMKQNTSGGAVAYQFSAVRAPLQPVYFEIKESPLITMREFMSRLFGQV